jgi:hypothetical protein
MAIPGIGYRTAADILMECSFHLSQPAVYNGLTAPVIPGVGVSANVGSTYAMYPGAQIILEVPGNAAQEAVTISSVPSQTQFTATFANPHAAAAPVWGATFPTQQATDPIYTQSEMLQYLSRAQNEFLTAVPCYYQRFFQTVQTGVLYQATPPTAILIDRIAASMLNLPIVSLTRTGNIVTLVSPIPHGLSQYSTFAVANPADNLGDPSFAGGAFAVISAPSPTSLTYRQIGPNATTTGGAMQSMLRLYEVTQEELTMQDRFWQSNYTAPLRSWFEDRAGLYQWGVGGKPSTNFPVELLCAIRDDDALAMLSGFLCPDVALHAVKYLTLNYAWTKEGVNQQPQMADFCMKRYTQIVLATQRYIKAMAMETKPQ